MVWCRATTYDDETIEYVIPIDCKLSCILFDAQTFKSVEILSVRY